MRCSTQVMGACDVPPQLRRERRTPSFASLSAILVREGDDFEGENP